MLQYDCIMCAIRTPHIDIFKYLILVKHFKPKKLISAFGELRRHYGSWLSVARYFVSGFCKQVFSSAGLKNMRHNSDVESQSSFYSHMTNSPRLWICVQ